MQAPAEAFLLLSIEVMTREKDGKVEAMGKPTKDSILLALHVGGFEGTPMAVAGVFATVQSFQLPNWSNTILGSV